MTVIKRNRDATKVELLEAVSLFINLLEDQDEDEAIAFLKRASKTLTSANSGSTEQKTSVKEIIDAFEGDHELIAYTHQRDGDQWTEVEELSQISSRVLSLAKRLR